MSGPVRTLPPLRLLLRGAWIIVRIWAAEQRFRHHARQANALEARRALHLDAMAAEVEFRVVLCRRYRPLGRVPCTASGVPVVSILDSLTMPAAAAPPRAPGPVARD